MKTIYKLLLIIPLVFITSCNSDDNETDQVTVFQSKTYTLTTVNNSGISGTVRFIENSNFTRSIELNVSGTSAGDFHSAFLYLDNAANDGEDIALTLDAVNGETGTSTTVFTTLDDGTPISYADLINFDGYVEVKSNDTNLNTPVANADIGQNELTTTQVTYTLEERDLTNAFGTITFKERLNGEALAVFNLEGTPASGMLPAHIHAGSVDSAPGAIILTFKTVNGTTGSSHTNISELMDGTPFVYDDVLTVDGYVNVHFENDLSLLIAQGNIGIN
ncbi:CHRD domain-containing protein [Lacinutrix chionoecetis]